MTQKKSNMVSGGIFFIEFITALVKAVVKLGGNEQTIFNAVRADSKIIDKFAQLIVNSVKTVKENILRILFSRRAYIAPILQDGECTPAKFYILHLTSE